MPLKQGKSQKAFDHNVSAEMHAGKPQNQALAISYSIKRKNAKKKASGGAVESGSKDMNMAEGGELSANNERRPMPYNRYNDSKEASRNSGNKPPKNDNWLDSPTVKQAQDNNGRQVKPIKQPKMVPQNAYSVRMRDEESDLQSSASPGPYGKQPPQHDNEEGPNRQGPKVSDMEDEHSTHAKPYNKAIEDQYSQDMADANMKRSNSYAKGGQIEPSDHMSHNINKRTQMEPMDDRNSLRLRDDEREMMDKLYPSEDEGDMYALDHNEADGNRQGPDVMDMEDEHTTGRKPYAEGGSIQYRDAMDHDDDEMDLNPAHDEFSMDDSEDQPQDEADMEHEDSIAASIMAKEERQMRLDSGASDMDQNVYMAEGGEIMHESDEHNSRRSIDSDDSDQTDLSRNADEDANMEDQLSFNALRKENYSESEGLEQLDNPEDSAQHGDDEELDAENQHDRVSRIMSKMNKNRQFKQR